MANPLDLTAGHLIHAGHALGIGIGAHHPIGEAALLVLYLLGEIPHRCQPQRSPSSKHPLVKDYSYHFSKAASV